MKSIKECMDFATPANTTGMGSVGMDDSSFSDALPVSKKKVKAGHIGLKDYIKAQIKASRDEEIAAHGKPVTFRNSLYKSKKTYTRKIKHKNTDGEE